MLQLGETTIAGAYPIVVTEMQMPVEKFSDSIYYTSIGFTKMFGYFGIGAAFVYTAYPENRKKTFTMILPLVISACLSSITEPIDFMFIFAAPLLYLLHSVIAGLFMAMLKAFGVIALWNGNLLGSILTNIANASKTEKMWLMWALGLSPREISRGAFCPSKNVSICRYSFLVFCRCRNSPQRRPRQRADSAMLSPPIGSPPPARFGYAAHRSSPAGG